MTSIFTDKSITPTTADLKKALGSTYPLWQTLEKFTLDLCPVTVKEWNFSGPKYGWSYRIKDKKRVIIYLLPRDKFFKAAFVFGQKATDIILASDISEEIKSELLQAKAYAEGRGIRIEVRNDKITDDLKKLIGIKCAG